MSKIPFEVYEKDLSTRSNRAKVTLFHRLIMTQSAGVVRSILRYCCIRLDKINSDLPDNDLGKVRHIEKVRAKYLLQGDEVI